MFIVERVKSTRFPPPYLALGGIELADGPVGWLRVLAPNLAALALAAVAILTQPQLRLSELTATSVVLLAVVLLAGRVLAPASLWRHHAVIAADAVATVVMLRMTGAPDSPFCAFGFAGAWAAAVRAGPHGGRWYAGLLSIGALVAILPGAFAQGMLSEALANLVSVLAVGELADALLMADPRVRLVADALLHAPGTPPGPDVRRRLGAVIGDALPLDAVMAAGHLGLTAEQTELVGYLLLGLTNQQISDAASVSEATVKYRLTHLYRDLHVQSRAQAVERVRSAGLDWTLEQAAAEGSEHWGPFAPDGQHYGRGA